MQLKVKTTPLLINSIGWIYRLECQSGESIDFWVYRYAAIAPNMRQKTVYSYQIIPTSTLLKLQLYEIEQ